jgi:hypothetical protein
MTQGNRTRRIRIVVVGAFAAISLTLGSGMSAWSWMSDGPQQPSRADSSAEGRSYSEKINPDGTCELVDRDGIPLYDSQFSERTGSSPCDQG